MFANTGSTWPDVIVAGHRRHAEQRLGIRPAAVRCQHPLVGQKRRALHEKHRERRKTNVGHPIAGVAARPLVGQLAAPLSQRRNVSFQPFHTELESRFVPLAKSFFSPCSQNENRWCLFASL
jgi:hypothetical protein